MRKLGSLASKPTTLGRIPDTRVAKGVSLPAPVEGWDAVSPISEMPPTRAIRLDNWFPQPGWVEARKGCRSHASCGIAEPVETAMPYQGVSSQELFYACDDSIFNGDGIGGALVSGLGNARFQYINFSGTGGHWLQCVNGVDAPQYYDGTDWLVATITGSSGPAININAFKGRIWYIPINSTKAEYLPVDSIQGAVKGFELGGEMTMGGHLVAMATWSVDGGNGPNDYAVFITSRGQVMIYKGTDPEDASDWGIVQKFTIGAPLGYRCFTNVGADVAIVCIDGVIPLSKAMIFERSAIVSATMTQNIQRVMNESARLYGNNFGWQLIAYPKGTRAILNVPISEGNIAHQYVMNTQTGAWCRFIGQNANCWALLNDNLYFGGANGILYQADVTSADETQPIRADMMTAYSYYGVRGMQKRWTMVQPNLTTDNQVFPGIAFNVDFQDNAPISVPSTGVSPGSVWDEAVWDVNTYGGSISTQTNWTSVSGIGQAASIRYVVDIDTFLNSLVMIWGEGLWGVNLWGPGSGGEITLQINGFNVVFEVGAFI